MTCGEARLFASPFAPIPHAPTRRLRPLAAHCLLYARALGADDHPHVYYPMDDPRLQTTQPASKNASAAGGNESTVCAALGAHAHVHVSYTCAST